MEHHEHRIINGLLKAVEDIPDPSVAAARLAVDCAIVAPPERSTMRDLWPCVWALASVLKRQFSGLVYIDCGLDRPLPAPARLGPRCLFSAAPDGVAVRLVLGRAASGGGLIELHGDARRACVTFGRHLEGDRPATPTSCFALAGYLGYAALAHAAGIPPFREDLVTELLMLPAGDEGNVPELPDVSIVGVGHLGQAYAALMFFETVQHGSAPRLLLLDSDRFETSNYNTQILLEDDGEWLGEPKASYLAARLGRAGMRVEGDVRRIQWGWRRPSSHPAIALLGLDSLESRRMAVAAGYDWLIEAGLGSSFERPRVTWHAMPPDNPLAVDFFPDPPLAAPELKHEKVFVEGLKRTPGQCGWLTYHSIHASAPSMGLLAASLVGSELRRFAVGTHEVVEGAALLWSPLLPTSRTAQARPQADSGAYH